MDYSQECSLLGRMTALLGLGSMPVHFEVLDSVLVRTVLNWAKRVLEELCQ